ncbi:NAD(P)-dependent oxidoreductase [Neobacillus ginsengisoli]|uniref:3-hydroxyisobutyrate dehydrogenase-like beta-hydroxyacid dehydrogenase n=1 Tax=Neobacillus ginsengisoli TaxID=904295 RepID=A0ABT9XWN0_9BACI|nr:NAD(P)-dependent oxidoreductase [Neobacillus ginsengisoli]MDQ0199349.1 3-hydroxyisobutyrate dehydrogenase-like beta-hydroxyacid dehydrogenase [Neobacillus ginsengisoli]
MKVGFIGLGTMGHPMAQNLLKKGYELTIYNRTKEKTELLKQQGAAVANSPKEVSLRSEIVFTMLTADAAVEEVVLGENGIVNGVHSGLIVVDSSTISPSTSKKLAAALSQHGVDMLDAPVTGSEPQAIQGILTFMVGGKKDLYEKCMPLFLAMGQAAYFMGENGKGSYTKLANNTMAAINLLSFTEGVTMATKAGIDPEIFVNVVSGGGARSGQVDNKASKVFNRDFTPHFMTQLIHKDLGLASNVAKELEISTPVLALAKEIFQMAKAKGYGSEDMSAVIKCYEEWAGVKVEKVKQTI